MLQPKVSIIIPVYNAEKYIEKCARSLFSQTLDNIEYVFVDDCSPDRSIRMMQEVLEEYPERKTQVKILENDHNIGVGQTRQRGIDAAIGEYIIHCDPDDWVDTEMYEMLYDRAKKTNADIVVCDFVMEYKSQKCFKKQNLSDSKKELFHKIANGEIHTSFCNKLIRASIARKFRIKLGVNLWEDMSVITAALMNSGKIEKINKTFYHYNMCNISSVTHDNRYKNSISKINAINILTEFLEISGDINKINSIDLYKLQWGAKRDLLSLMTKSNLILWNKTFPSVNNLYLNIGLSNKSKVLTFLAKHNCYILLKIYDKIIGL